MVTGLTPDAQDQIMLAMQQFRADPRKNKVDPGVGLFKAFEGRTPVMAAIKSA